MKNFKKLSTKHQHKANGELIRKICAPQVTNHHRKANKLLKNTQAWKKHVEIRNKARLCAIKFENSKWKQRVNHKTTNTLQHWHLIIYKFINVFA